MRLSMAAWLHGDDVATDGLFMRGDPQTKATVQGSNTSLMASQPTQLSGQHCLKYKYTVRKCGAQVRVCACGVCPLTVAGVLHNVPTPRRVMIAIVGEEGFRRRWQKVERGALWPGERWHADTLPTHTVAAERAVLSPRVHACVRRCVAESQRSVSCTFYRASKMRGRMRGELTGRQLHLSQQAVAAVYSYGYCMHVMQPRTQLKRAICSCTNAPVRWSTLHCWLWRRCYRRRPLHHL
jgi:hypothetical protein